MKRIASLPATSLLVLALLASACSKEKVCPVDETNVGGTCLALRSDPSNCGARGNACAAGQGCSAGTCVDCASSSGLCTTAVVAACLNLDQIRPLGASLAPSDAPLATDDAPIALAKLGGAFFVANSRSSTVSRVTLSPPSAANGASSFPLSPAGGFPDLEDVAVRNGVLWVTNAATNTLVGLDPTTGAVVDEIPLSANAFAFPQGIAFSGTKAYVALNGANEVAVVDLAVTPRTVTRIDLSGLGTGAAAEAPSRLAVVGSRLYVTLNDLFDPSFTRVPGANGMLAAIDLATDTVAGPALDLGPACLNASGIAVSGTTLWIACGFFDQFGTGGVFGTAIVPVELASGTPVAGAAIPLSSAATSIALCDGRGYAGASESGTVVSFDPATRTVLGSALVCPPEPGRLSYVPALACPN